MTAIQRCTGCLTDDRNQATLTFLYRTTFRQAQVVGLHSRRFANYRVGIHVGERRKRQDWNVQCTAAGGSGLHEDAFSCSMAAKKEEHFNQHQRSLKEYHFKFAAPSVPPTFFGWQRVFLLGLRLLQLVLVKGCDFIDVRSLSHVCSRTKKTKQELQ